MTKTYSIKASDIRREWHLIDASDQVLGRVATRIAGLLMGKHKPLFSRNMDVGDFVVVVNADKIRVTGNKAKQKLYHRHSGYPGGLKSVSLEKMMATKPTRVIEHAVKGMLPKNRLEAGMMKRLRVYAGDSHPHRGQIAAVPAETAGKGEDQHGDEKGESRGASPLWQGSGGVPQIQSLPPSWLGRGSGGWSKGFFSSLLGGRVAGNPGGFEE